MDKNLFTPIEDVQAQLDSERSARVRSDLSRLNSRQTLGYGIGTALMGLFGDNTEDPRLTKARATQNIVSQYGTRPYESERQRYVDMYKDFVGKGMMAEAMQAKGIVDAYDARKAAADAENRKLGIEEKKANADETNANSLKDFREKHYGPYFDRMPNDGSGGNGSSKNLTWQNLDAAQKAWAAQLARTYGVEVTNKEGTMRPLQEILLGLGQSKVGTPQQKAEALQRVVELYSKIAGMDQAIGSGFNAPLGGAAPVQGDPLGLGVN